MEGKSSTSWKENTGILISILVGIITLYFGANNPQIGISLLVSVYFFIVIYFIVDFFVSLAKKKIDQINKNSEDINNINKELLKLKSDMDFHLEISKIKAKVEAMEGKKKKGIIDPRIVIIVIILILFYLYLRSIHILN